MSDFPDPHCPLAALAAEAARLIANLAASEGEPHSRFWRRLQAVEAEARGLAAMSAAGAFFLLVLSLRDVDEVLALEVLSDEAAELLGNARKALAAACAPLEGTASHLSGYYLPRGAF